MHPTADPLAEIALHDARLLRPYAYIGGRWCAAQDGAEDPVVNPADDRIVGHVARLTASEARNAVQVASDASADWAAQTDLARATLLGRWAALIQENVEDLAHLMVTEQGKPISEARGEVAYAAAFAAFHATPLSDALSDITPSIENARTQVRRVPLGVVALVTPWNFPLAMLTREAAAALAAGCTVVAHPSPQTPFSALALAELAERAGLPPGVFNVVTGRSPDIVGAWMSDPRVRGVSFTGSIGIGELIYKQAAQTMKRLVLELGGHAPFVVFAQADQDRAVEQAIPAKFATSGQDCLAANRFFIERPAYAEFCTRFAARTTALSVGPGLDDPDIGPLINADAVMKQQSQVEDALSRGARLLTGGKPHPAGANFFQPTVSGDVPPDAAIMREETFGPVAAIAPFNTEAEVIARANGTEYGLVAYLHDTDEARLARITDALDFGMIAVNRTSITGQSRLEI